MAVFVKSHRRGKSVVKAYLRARVAMASANAVGNYKAHERARKSLLRAQKSIRSLYRVKGSSSRAMSSDSIGFLSRLSIRALRRAGVRD